MATTSNVLSFERRRTHTVSLDASGRRVVDACRRLWQEGLEGLLDGLFEKLDDALYELADKSESNQLQSEYFTAMRVLRKVRPDIQRQYLAVVMGDFDRLWREGPRHLTSESEPLASDRFGDLGLVANDELEESLAVSNLISKGENRHHQELDALDQRFGHLLGQPLDRHSNPLAPEPLAHHYRDLIRELEVGLPVKLVIYKLFDKQVMDPIGGLYARIDALLVGQGVLPHLPRGRLRSPAGVEPVRGRGTVGGVARPSSPSAEAESAGSVQNAIEGEVFATLSQLLSRYRRQHTDGGAPPGLQNVAPAVPVTPVVPAGLSGGSTPEFATSELVAALTDLQHLDLPAAGESTPATLAGHLQAILQKGSQGQPHHLAAADQDTLDVISMLFEFILEDRALPDAMKALIARLQIPILKVALLDKSFFSHKLHPARRLLNDLSQAAASWTDEGDRSGNGLYGRIEAIVEQVIAEFEDDPGIFERLGREFAAYLEREQRGAEIAEERTTQVTRGKEQLRAARARVSDEIGRRLKGRPAVPVVVRDLLEGGWRDVMLLTLLRNGEDSADWHKALMVADQLLWSCEPKSTYADRQELLRAIPKLLRDLREGLSEISFDQHRTARLFKELQSLHIASLRGQSVAAPQHLAAVSEPVVEAPVPADGGETPPAEDDAFMRRAQALPVGTWLEMKETDGRRMRIKLSWKSDVTDAFIFVNRKGIKVLEMTQAEVAQMLQRGTAEVLEEVESPLVDRALGAMVENLKRVAGE